ncbi:MAG: dihydrofolate reductase [Bacteroidetes bacterium]|jgi:dihydrofolate reductase|nr:dihydrofolate reductase [Bacteroidota bacterium]MBT6687082.1 dihydrofolate reductase [Bacteroidota bacterium]MBT7142815.1 dihydrofolate reductase [Bacteroidota bacterium]MBT7492654.1 dihydrofolate reductase [Bacteroidota bacterium]
MIKKNSVFIAKSLDGYISDKNGGLDWLNSISNPDEIDMGYELFMKGIDAIVMGRKTFEAVCNFDIDWPYSKPVFVLSRSLEIIPANYENEVGLVKGSIINVVKKLNQRGYDRLYIDGGSTIQSFLKEDHIDELIITTIPILLGGGATLFSELPDKLEFKHVESKVFLGDIVQNHYKRKR